MSVSFYCTDPLHPYVINRIIVGFLFLATKDVITYRSRITVVNLSNSLLDKEPIFLSLPRFTFLEFRFQLLDRGKITAEI